MHSRRRRYIEANHTQLTLTHRAAATLLQPSTSATALLLDLIRLLAGRLFPLVPVLDGQVERIVGDLELGADAGFHRLDETLRALRLLVLILVCAEDVVDGREGELLELGCVFLDNGHTLLQLGER